MKPDRLFPPSRLPQTATMRVYNQLKQAICKGELRPGTPLLLRNVALSLKVSQTPVIEAIRCLERDGLVTTVPRWGATVKEWSWDEMVEAMYIRRALEAQAAELFVMRATEDDKKQLVELNREFNRLESLKDPDRTAEASEVDVELHLHVARSTRLPRFFELIENSNIERTVIFAAAVYTAPGGDSFAYALSVLGAHDGVVQALLGDDPEAARIEMVRHLDVSVERLKAHWGTQKGSPEVLTQIVNPQDLTGLRTETKDKEAGDESA